MSFVLFLISDLFVFNFRPILYLWACGWCCQAYHLACLCWGAHVILSTMSTSVYTVYGLRHWGVHQEWGILAIKHLSRYVCPKHVTGSVFCQIYSRCCPRFPKYGDSTNELLIHQSNSGIVLRD